MDKVPFAQFYEENVGLAHRVARKVFSRLSAMGAAVEYGDVLQEASLVMMRAYEKFDPSLGFKFSTYFTRAAYYELNNFVKDYENDVSILRVTSMQAAIGDDDELIDMESSIDGGHGTPEEMLEAKELLEEIESKLSPLANKILDIMVDPPEMILNEWESTKKQATGRNEMTVGFVVDYLSKITPFSKLEIRSAGSEISALRGQINL